MLQEQLKSAEEAYRASDRSSIDNASLMLAGINPKIVQERLGHSSIDVTLDTYSHLTLANQSIAVDALERVIAKKAE